MKSLLLIMLATCISPGLSLAQISDTWVATDSLGRTLPNHDQVGNIKEDKYVAMFYWTWHTERNADGGVVNVNQIVSKYPEAINDYNHPVWKGGNTPNHWNEPLFGYYRIQDRWVLRKHAEMLSDAGVDVVFFDCSNSTLTWRAGYEALFSVWMEARKDGVKTPDIAFLCPFGATENSRVMLEILWEDIYRKGYFKDLWFYWQGKPLIMAYPDNVSEKIKNFFTFRPPQPDYRKGPSRDDHWSWLEVYPQKGYVEYAPGKYEMVAVGTSQNATDSLAPAAMNDARGQVYGRSYTRANGFDSRPQAHHYGLNFQEQWSRAFELDPKLVFITGWNEWIAGRFKEWQGTENAFPDQFCNEYSRDIEPMKGGHGDNYYYQLISNIRRFKGLQPQESASGVAAIKIDGDFQDWSLVKPLYLDHKGDTSHRRHRGYGHDLLYVNNTGRNDFTRAKVACNQSNIFFYIETAQSITPQSDADWMTLLIDIDRDKATGRQGYDYLVNRKRTKKGKTSICKWDKSSNWKELSEIDFKVIDNKMELAIPRSLFFDISDKINFEFKWADNIKVLDDPMDFYLYGDVAPSARFNYLYSCDR